MAMFSTVSALLLEVNATQRLPATAFETPATFISQPFQSVLVAVLLIAIAILVLWQFRQVIVNSILGLVALFLLQLIGINLPVNIFTIIISAALGLVGVGLMIILYVLGFTF